MSQVFVLTFGVWPDDTLIEGVFDSQDKAEAWAALKLEGKYGWDIATMTLNEGREAYFL